MKFYKLNNDEVFNVTLISDADINVLAVIVTLNYKLSFKVIN